MANDRAGRMLALRRGVGAEQAEAVEADVRQVLRELGGGGSGCGDIPWLPGVHDGPAPAPGPGVGGRCCRAQEPPQGTRDEGERADVALLAAPDSAASDGVSNLRGQLICFRVVLAKQPTQPDGHPAGIITAFRYSSQPAHYP